MKVVVSHSSGNENNDSEEMILTLSGNQPWLTTRIFAMTVRSDVDLYIETKFTQTGNVCSNPTLSPNHFVCSEDLPSFLDHQLIACSEINQVRFPAFLAFVRQLFEFIQLA